METVDDGLPINSNMVTDGFEMVFHWSYGLSSIKQTDNTSREARPSVHNSTARINLISFYNENEFVRSEAVLGNPTIRNRMLLESNHFSSGLSPYSVASSLI